MTTKPEWVRLADELDSGLLARLSMPYEAANELRRLGKENEGYRTLVNNAVSGLKNEEARIAAVTHLVRQLHQAKGRYHTQIAAAELFELCGLPAERPKK